jgi:hypothetical protein
MNLYLPHDTAIYSMQYAGMSDELVDDQANQFTEQVLLGAWTMA